MRATRLYIDRKLAVDDEVRLDDESAHHASHVLRINKHSSLALFNGDGYDYAGQLISLRKKAITVRVTGKTLGRKESRLQTHLVLGVSKSAHMDFAIQKSVEAGVTEIHPVTTERTVIRFSDKSRARRQQHWRNVVISACQQSGRATLPVLHEVKHLSETLPVDEGARGFVLDIRSNRTLGGYAHERLKKIWLVTGPEGGLTHNETQGITDKGFLPVSLGPRIMRTETAALAAIISAQVLWGDLSEHDSLQQT